MHWVKLPNQISPSPRQEGFHRRSVAYVCVCVFVLFHREGFFQLQDVWDMFDGHGYVVSIIPGASDKFLHLSIWKSSPPKMKLQHADKLKKNDIIYSGHDIHQLRPKADELRKDTKDKVATLI